MNPVSNEHLWCEIFELADSNEMCVYIYCIAAATDAKSHSDKSYQDNEIQIKMILVTAVDNATRKFDTYFRFSV